VRIFGMLYFIFVCIPIFIIVWGMVYIFFVIMDIKKKARKIAKCLLRR